jgi:hypothetical protein
MYAAHDVNDWSNKGEVSITMSRQRKKNDHWDKVEPPFALLAEMTEYNGQQPSENEHTNTTHNIEPGSSNSLSLQHIVIQLFISADHSAPPEVELG